MLVMEQIETIKELQVRGLSPSEIARKLSVDWKTVVKYMQQECYSPKPPSVRCAESKLDPWKPVIDGWLDEDRKVRYKQRHTAKRVFDRLYEECPGFTGSYPIVQRYVKQVREAKKQTDGFLELICHPAKHRSILAKPTSTHRRDGVPANIFARPSPTAMAGCPRYSAVKRQSASARACKISLNTSTAFPQD